MDNTAVGLPIVGSRQGHPSGCGKNLTTRRKQGLPTFLISSEMNVSIVLLGLQSLYDALNGRHWVYTGTGAEWSFDNLTVNPCEPPWQFLKCDDNGLLYDIIIKECNATGKLSDASVFFNNAYMQENLTSLLLHTSNITGTIPTSMYQLTALTRIELVYNQLSGTIPTMYMENLKNLNYISMNNNKLTGTFPAAFNSLVKLSTIILSSNFLTGSIPTITLNNLEVLNLGNNSFSSTLPVIHSSILKELVLSNNSFSGKLNPDTIGGMESLTLLLLFKNKLTSSLPEQLEFLTSLTTLSLSNNQLTGNVDILANLKKLEELRLSYNQFTGEIPRLEDAISLRILDLTDNNFRGRISSSLFSAMLNLQNVSLSFNQFSGPFPNLTANENLISVDVIGNQFTGFIPASLFESNTNLLTFAASKNCLHRKIPDSICGADSLEELLLSGLHQAQCSFNVFLGSIINPVAIPDCIWSMKNIRQLYLDGNGYAAMLTMHETDFQMKNLTHFSIGYNRIRGELPAQLDNRKMEVFNIANNAITGSLNDVHIIPSNIFTSEFKADLNRYSGELDLSILESYQQQIDVLNGNLIACGFQPTNDINYSSYSCGTQNFNYSIYLWIFSLVVSLLLYCIIVKSEHPYIKQLYSKYIQQNSISKMSSDYVKENFPCTLQFLSSLERLATGSVAIVMFQVITTVIIYVALKEGPERYHYRTLTHQYWLTISGVFLRGWQPAVVMICIHHLVVLLLIGILFHCFISNWNLMKFHDGRKRRELIQKSLTTWQKCWEISWKERFDQMQKTIYRVFVIGTFISFSCGANVLYIYQKKDLEGVKLILLQLFVALYYNIARFLIPTISSHLYHTQEDDVGLVTTTSMIITSINLVVIDVMIPFIATLFSDDLCFAQVVNGIPPINSMITDSSCLAYYNQTTQCAVVSDSSVTLDFYPDFIYSNQCR